MSEDNSTSPTSPAAAAAGEDCPAGGGTRYLGRDARLPPLTAREAFAYDTGFNAGLKAAAEAHGVRCLGSTPGPCGCPECIAADCRAEGAL